MKNKTIAEKIEFAKSGSSEELVKKIREIEIPEDVENLIDEYEEKCGDREKFLWKWVYTFTIERNPGIVLSVVPEKCTEKMGKLKNLLVVLI